MKIPYRRMRKLPKKGRRKTIRILGFLLSVSLARLLHWRMTKAYGPSDTGRISSSSLFQSPSHIHRKRPYYKLLENRFLVLHPANAGINNQLQCLNVAANLAIAYNRTLMLQRNTYSGSHHGKEPIPFHELIDAPNVRFSVALVDTFPNVATKRINDYNPEHVATSTILADPYPTIDHLEFHCSYGDLHHSLPESAPHRDEVLFPFHPIYEQVARRVIASIQNHVGHDEVGNFRLLGIHVRQGDLKGYPAFVCPETGFPQLFAFQEGGWWLAACTNQQYERLSWDRLLAHLASCDDKSAIPLCSKDYHAIFVATNDVKYVKSWNISNLFVLDDFPFVRDTFCATTCNNIKDFLVEEMILILSHVFQPSAPSSITDIVLHHRLDEHRRNDHDEKLYRAYDDLLLRLKKERKGNIMNWERFTESLTTSKNAKVLST